MSYGWLRNLHTCYECIWFDQCADDKICEDFSPAEASFEITYYENDLEMRIAAYQEMIDEYSDENAAHDDY